MTVIIVISAIIIIFAILLNIKIKAEISYINGDFVLKVKYLCFTIFPPKEKKKKIKKEKKNKDLETNKANTVPDTDEVSAAIQDDSEQTNEIEKNSKEPLYNKIDKLFETLEKVKIIWDVSKKPLINIFKRVYIEELMIDFLIADEDAYTTAMNYGKINIAVYNIINFIRTFFTITIKTVDIVCDFNSKKSVYDFSAKITVKPSTVFSAVFIILFGLLINLKKLIGTKNTKQTYDAESVSM